VYFSGFKLNPLASLYYLTNQNGILMKKLFAASLILFVSCVGYSYSPQAEAGRGMELCQYKHNGVILGTKMSNLFGKCPVFYDLEIDIENNEGVIEKHLLSPVPASYPQRVSVQHAPLPDHLDCPEVKLDIVHFGQE
jgi:hypothetical protein